MFVPEISLGTSKFKVDYVSLTTPMLRAICHPLLKLDTAYIRAKFEHSSFSSSGDMVDAHQKF